MQMNFLQKVAALSWLLTSPALVAETVAIDYVLDTAVASVDPLTVPNPQGGADIAIAPSITIDSGVFDGRFLNADAAGTIADGDASVIGVEFSGSIVLELSSSIDVFGFPLAVTATISGPLTAQQQTPSPGTLTGLAVYAETSPGDYDLSAGPLGCTDSALGVFCTAIETALGGEFPIDGIGGTSPLPFAGGAFDNLNGGSGSPPSSVSAQIDFSFPLTDDISFGVDIESDWVEIGRVLQIPEPSVSLLLVGACAILLRRRR